jgi:hypothetical protein
MARTSTDTPAAAAPEAPAPQRQGYVPVPLPAWRWRTFPVYFAFALGLFLGVYAGAIAGIVNENGNNVPMLAVFLIAAVLLGLGLSRLSTRWMMSRNWIKPRPRKR